MGGPCCRTSQTANVAGCRGSPVSALACLFCLSRPGPARTCRSLLSGIAWPLERPVSAAANPPVYLLLHVPKAAGQTIELHLIEHSAAGMVWIPRQPAPWEAITGARHGRRGIPDLAGVRVVSGHYLTRSLESHFRGREIRRAVLLRDPVSLCVSLYNYRMMSYLARGRSTYGFALHRRTLTRDFVAHFLLSRWLERRSVALLAMPDEHKYDLLNKMLSDFWFVGAYHDADRLVAAIAPDLGVPAMARRRNSAGDWQRRTRWRPLTTDQLSAAERAEIIASNPIDWALWRNWRDAGFAGAGVRPSARRDDETGRIFRARTGPPGLHFGAAGSARRLARPVADPKRAARGARPRRSGARSRRLAAGGALLP